MTMTLFFKASNSQIMSFTMLGVWKIYRQKEESLVT